MRILLLLNGPRERYAGGADTARQDKWREYCSPETELEIGYLPSVKDTGGVPGVYGFGTKEALSLGAFYPDRCAAAEQQGFDAVIIHCFVDPGLRLARERVSIPVVGPGEVTLRAGGILNRKIGIITPSSETLDSYDEYVKDLGLEDRVTGIEAIKGGLAPFPQQNPREMTQAVVEAVERLAARGAEVICPSGLAYIPIRVSAAEVSTRAGIPVLDPALISVRTAEMLVSSLQGGRDLR
jgi:Asp/Glu/hydantoin racemase